MHEPCDCDRFLYIISIFFFFLLFYGRCTIIQLQKNKGPRIIRLGEVFVDIYFGKLILWMLNDISILSLIKR